MPLPNELFFRVRVALFKNFSDVLDYLFARIIIR